MDMTILIGLVAGLFFAISAAEPLAARLRLPLAIVLCMMGAGLGLGALAVQQSPAAALMEWELRRVLELRIPSNLFLSVFLPVLIFQAALSLDIRRMLEDSLPIMVMAILAVILATLTVGVALTPFSSIGIYGCLLIGAIISTTDPSAVIDIFRSISAPPRLVRIIQGESLLNDATAIALFSFFLAFVTAGVPNPEPLEVAVQVPLMMFGGLACGWAVARLVVPVMAWMSGWPTAQITMSVAIPFTAFLLAEAIGYSGVIAAFASGLVLNLMGQRRIAPAVWRQITDAWSLMAHWAGALIFLLAALLIPRLLETAVWTDICLIGAAMLAALVSRAAVLWGVLPVLTAAKLSPPIPAPYRVTILWGGLRGAVTLALALAVTEAIAVPAEIKRMAGIVATGYVLSVFLIQGLTLRPLIRGLGLDRLQPIDQALSDQVIAVALQDVREEVSNEVRDRGVDHEIIRSEAKRLGELTQAAVERAEEANKVLDRERIALGLIALAGHERDLVAEGVRDGRIGSELQMRLTQDCARIIEMTRTGGRPGYRAAARISLGDGRRLRFAAFLHRRLRLSGMLAAITAERIEVLIAQRVILEDLHRFVDGRIRRIHGKRVTEILHEILSQRQEKVNALLEGLSLQYPQYAEDVGRRWVRRMALRLEEKEYETLLADSLIVPEVHKTLTERIARDRNALSRRPRLDMGIQKGALLRRLEIFRDMDDAEIKRLSRALHVRHVEPGEVLQAKDGAPAKVFLIGSGAVEVSGKTGDYRLGQGDLFGHISLLAKAPRRAEIRALTHGTVFELEEVRFQRLLQRNEPLRKSVLESAARLGVNLEGAFDKVWKSA